MNRVIALIIAASCFAAGCGSTVESDAAKLAELQCRSLKLAEKVGKGDMSVIKESTQLSLDAAKLRTEIEGKYTSDEDKQALAKAYLEALDKCK